MECEWFIKDNQCLNNRLTWIDEMTAAVEGNTVGKTGWTGIAAKYCDGSMNVGPIICGDGCMLCGMIAADGSGARETCCWGKCSVACAGWMMCWACTDVCANCTKLLLSVCLDVVLVLECRWWWWICWRFERCKSIFSIIYSALHSAHWNSHLLNCIGSLESACWLANRRLWTLYLSHRNRSFDFEDDFES